jgi:thiosulfate reductase cytochrome b subunit
MAERIYVFKRFERFWHWSQAGLIMFLMLTAFDIHGTYTIFGFEKAVAYHTIGGMDVDRPVGVRDLLALHHRRMEAVHPDHGKVVAMMNYYLVGIFKNAPHPFKPDHAAQAQSAAAPGLSRHHAVRRAADLGHRRALPVL